MTQAEWSLSRIYDLAVTGIYERSGQTRKDMKELALLVSIVAAAAHCEPPPFRPCPVCDRPLDWKHDEELCDASS